MNRLTWKKFCSQIMIACACVCCVMILSACGDNGEDRTAQELLDEAYAAASDSKNPDWEKALALAGRAYNLNRNDSSIRIMYALALDRNGKTDEAITVMEGGGKNDESSFMAQYTLGRLYYQKGEYEKAIAPLELAYKMDPDDRDLMLMLEQTYVMAGKGVEAEKMYKALIAKFGKEYNTKNAFLYNEIALIEYVLRGKEAGRRLTREQNAYTYFNWAAKLAPESPEIQWNKAVYWDYVHESAGVRYIGKVDQRGARNIAKNSYKDFLRLTQGMQGWDTEREFARKRINQIR